MTNLKVMYGETPARVYVMLRADGVAQYRLTKNARTVEMSEGAAMIEADEVYFEIGADNPQPTKEEVESNFDAYWQAGAAWPVQQKTVEQRLGSAEAVIATHDEEISQLVTGLEALANG